MYEGRNCHASSQHAFNADFFFLLKASQPLDMHIYIMVRHSSPLYFENSRIFNYINQIAHNKHFVM